MINIRSLVFETNSSATHSVSLITRDEYNKFLSGDYFLDFDDGIIYTKEEAFTIARSKRDYNENMDEDDIRYMLADYSIFDIDTYRQIIEDNEYTEEDTFVKGSTEYIVLSHFCWD